MSGRVRDGTGRRWLVDGRFQRPAAANRIIEYCYLSSMEPKTRLKLEYFIRPLSLDLQFAKIFEDIG